MPTDMCDNGALIFFQISPNKGLVFTFDRMVEKLFGQTGYSMTRFSNYKQATGIFIYPVNQSESW